MKRGSSLVNLPLLLAFLLLIVWIPRVQAQETHPTTPHLASTQLLLNLDQPTCMARAKTAVTAAGLITHIPVETAQGGSNARLFALITCLPAQKQTLIVVSVAGSPGSKSETVRTCNFLDEFMRTGKAPDGVLTVISNQHITLANSVFTVDEEVDIQWDNVPGQGDWITIVPAGSPDDTWGNWWYTDGNNTGTKRAGKLKPGNYEVRVYFDWPNGGFIVKSRLTFSVVTERATADTTTGANDKKLTTLVKTTFSPTEDIEVEWDGLPGAKGDWVTVVPAGSPDDTWGNWWFTAGKTTGSYNIGRLEPGKYEIRAYFNWPDGGYAVQSRVPFTVQ